MSRLNLQRNVFLVKVPIGTSTYSLLCPIPWDENDEDNEQQIMANIVSLHHLARQIHGKSVKTIKSNLFNLINEQLGSTVAPGKRSWSAPLLETSRHMFEWNILTVAATQPTPRLANGKVLKWLGAIQYMHLVDQHEKLINITDDETNFLHFSGEDYQENAEKYGFAVRKYCTISAFSGYEKLAVQNPFKKGYPSNDSRLQAVLLSEITQAKVPKSNLAVQLQDRIQCIELEDRAVTSEESDSEDSAIRVALSEQSADSSEVSDEEIQAEIHGESVNNSDNEDILTEAQKFTIAPFINQGLTIPEAHDYARALAATEAEILTTTDENRELRQEGWVQMFKEIQHNLEMGKSFYLTYQGRMELTKTQVLLWIQQNKSKFKKFPDIWATLQNFEHEMGKSLQKKKENKEKFLKQNKMRALKILGQVWNPIPKPSKTSGSVKATRDEWEHYLISRLTKLFAALPHPAELIKTAEPWIRRSMRNQALFEDCQQKTRTIIKNFGLTGKTAFNQKTPKN